MIHLNQIENFHCITLASEILRHRIIEFRFAVGDDDALIPSGSL